LYPCIACVAEKILFGLPPAVTVVKDNDTILDAVRRNSLLPGAVSGANGSSGMRASLSVPPPVITRTDATPQSSPNDSVSTAQRPLPQLLQCPPFNGDATLSPYQQVSPQSLPSEICTEMAWFIVWFRVQVRVTYTNYVWNYLCPGSYVLPGVPLSVCLFVRLSVCLLAISHVKTTDRTFMNFYQRCCCACGEKRTD